MPKFQALSAALVEFNRRFGLRTSGLQFSFWFILLVCGIPQLRTQIRWRLGRYPLSDFAKYHEYNFISYIVFYALSIVVLILNCFADKAPLDKRYHKSDVSVSSSFCRPLFSSWMQVRLSILKYQLRRNFWITIREVNNIIHLNLVLRTHRASHQGYFAHGLILWYGRAIKHHWKIKISVMLTPRTLAKKLCLLLANIGNGHYPNRLEKIRKCVWKWHFLEKQVNAYNVISIIN